MSADDRTPEETQEHVRDARTPGAPDIMASPTKARFPLSRGAPERKLRRVDFYDRRAEVTKYEALTPTQTVRISFRVVDNGAFSFVPGQFIGIQAEVPGYGWRRSPYCIVSPPNGERTFQLLIRLVPQGPLSYYLGRLRPGDVIAFRGPLGRCMVPKTSDEELILLATGVGIGPFLSLAYVAPLFSRSGAVGRTRSGHPRLNDPGEDGMAGTSPDIAGNGTRGTLTVDALPQRHL